MDMNYDFLLTDTVYFPTLNSLVNFEKSSPTKPTIKRARFRSLFDISDSWEVYKIKRK